MLQIKNNTPFEPFIGIFPNKDGIDTLYLLVKATFDIDKDIKIAEKQIPPFMADEYWGEPDNSSLKYTTDMHIGKPSTDVALIGQAWAPDEVEATRLEVTVTVAEREKTVIVYGDRTFKKGLTGLSITKPEPFLSIPLVYERAFGGIHIIDAENNKIKGEDRNPVGVGFKGKRKSKEFDGYPVPNLEDPKSPFKGLTNKSIPSCFGFIAPGWLPRRKYAGTYDEAWQKNRAPYLPKDFDPRFLNAAHPDLTFDRYLNGGEPVTLINVSPRGPIEFELPSCQFSTTVKTAGSSEKPPLNLETVLFEPEENRLSMVWRGSLTCDKKTLEVEEVTFEVEILEGIKEK